MKLMHLSDLHLGKRVNEFNMLPDQEFILLRILDCVDRERPDAVLIAGDVYDKAMPPAEAVRLFDDFLVRLSRRGIPVFVISGNHDSPERIAFGGRLMEKSGVFLSPVYDGSVKPFRLEDEYGALDLWLLPFLKPAHVRRFFPEEEIDSYTRAMETVIAHMPLDRSRRNVLVTHQFVTGAERSESEEISVGGSDNVDASVFEPFDYVALGHIHGPQNVGSERIRYCGTPLKYSFSEAEQNKSVTIAQLGEKGRLSVRTLPLVPRRDLRRLRGSYLELTARDFYRDTPTDDYLQITLTDEQDVPDALAKLRVIYPNLMKLEYDNARARAAADLDRAEEPERRSPLELLEEFYEKQNGLPLGPEQRDFARELMETIWEAEG